MCKQRSVTWPNFRIGYLDQSAIIAHGALKSFAVLAGGRVVNPDTPVLASGQNVLLALVRFHVVEGRLAHDVVTARKLYLTIAGALEARKTGRAG